MKKFFYAVFIIFLSFCLLFACSPPANPDNGGDAIFDGGSDNGNAQDGQNGKEDENGENDGDDDDDNDDDPSQKTAVLSDGTPLSLANSVGNSAANLANGGKMAFQGEAVYFANASDSDTLYKTMNGQTVKLCDMRAAQVNVAGEYVYFVVPLFRTLYRVAITGGTPEKVTERDADNLIVADGHIYYCAAAEGYTLRKLDFLAGTDTALPVSGAMYVHYYEGRLYYQVYKNNSYKLMRINTDGTDDVQIADLKQNCSAIAFYNGRIFHKAVVKVDGVTKYRLYSMKTDGTDAQLVTANEPFFLNISDDKVYYSNTDDAYKLYCVKTDGSGNKKIHDYATENIYTNGSNVYTRAFIKENDYVLEG